MATEITMPQLGESVVEGTVGKWLKKEGDKVAKYEPLLEVITEKVTTEVPSAAEGVLLKILVPEGQTVKAGTIIAWIGESGEKIPEAPTAPPEAKPAEAKPTEAKPGAEAAPPPGAKPTAPKREEGGGPPISPVVAKMAAEHNIDLNQIMGTGEGGRITKKDVEKYLETMKAVQPEEQIPGLFFREPGKPLEEAPPAAKPIAPAPGAQALSPMRRAIAEHMVRSKHTAAHVTTVFEVDLSRVVAYREANKDSFQAREGIALTYTPFFVLASVAGLKAVPLVNSSLTEDKLVLHRDVNIGVAVAISDGLIVPVIKKADEKSLSKIAQEVNDLANRARQNKLKPDDVSGGTFTITNHGVAGSLFATPIINQPQAAILGVGMIQKRAVVVGDAITIRPMVYLSLTFDHRIMDGAIADQFLAKVKEYLEGFSAP
ncbi:MAG: 2-oxo acid dehydrogenase subunit E2 [Chloroflexi bacterium]|nr:2-oxo acid dehydrogenase subunit E2 [Chloroflexota bacterium]